MYEEVLDDPKVQRLPLELFKIWVNVLALASRHGGSLPSISDCAFAFREPESVVSSAFHRLEDTGLLKRKDETFRPNGWDKRQYKSDTSTERVKLFRKRSRSGNETASDAEAETDKKKINPSHPSDVRPPTADPRGCRLAADWLLPADWRQWALEQGIPPPLIDKEAARFADYWHGAPGAKGRKADWPATWRNWMRDKIDGKFSKGTSPTGTKPTQESDRRIMLETLGLGVGVRGLDDDTDAQGAVLEGEYRRSH